MRIERRPPPPPREVALVFPVAEGWAIVAALKDYAAAHPDAHDIAKWRQWASDLDAELRAFA